MSRSVVLNILVFCIINFIFGVVARQFLKKPKLIYDSDCSETGYEKCEAGDCQRPHTKKTCVVQKFRADSCAGESMAETTILIDLDTTLSANSLFPLQVKSVIEGDNVNLVCKVSGGNHQSESPKMKWMFGDEYLHENHRLLRHAVSLITDTDKLNKIKEAEICSFNCFRMVSRLYISRVTTTHQGNFECRVKRNDGMWQRSKLVLNVIPFDVDNYPTSPVNFEAVARPILNRKYPKEDHYVRTEVKWSMRKDERNTKVLAGFLLKVKQNDGTVSCFSMSASSKSTMKFNLVFIGKLKFDKTYTFELTPLPFHQDSSNIASLQQKMPINPANRPSPGGAYSWMKCNQPGVKRKRYDQVVNPQITNIKVDIYTSDISFDVLPHPSYYCADRYYVHAHHSSGYDLARLEVFGWKSHKITFSQNGRTQIVELQHIGLTNAMPNSDYTIEVSLPSCPKTPQGKCHCKQRSGGITVYDRNCCPAAVLSDKLHCPMAFRRVEVPARPNVFIFDGISKRVLLFDQWHDEVRKADFELRYKHGWPYIGAYKNKIIIAGGQLERNTPPKAELLVFTRGSVAIRDAPPMKTPRFQGAATVAGDKFIVCGGYQEPTESAPVAMIVIANCEAYNFENNGWREIEPLPKAMWAGVAATLRFNDGSEAPLFFSGKVLEQYVVGERYSGIFAFEYDLNSGRWKEVPMLTGDKFKWEYAAATSIGDTIIYCGGMWSSRQSKDTLNDKCLYYRRTTASGTGIVGEWATMTQAKHSPTMVPWGRGAFVIGGENVGRKYNKIESVNKDDTPYHKRIEQPKATTPTRLPRDVMFAVLIGAESHLQDEDQPLVKNNVPQARELKRGVEYSVYGA